MSWRPLKGAVSAEKALQGSKTEMRELLQLNCENSISLMRGHWLAGKSMIFHNKETEFFFTYVALLIWLLATPSAYYLIFKKSSEKNALVTQPGWPEGWGIWQTLPCTPPPQRSGKRCRSIPIGGRSRGRRSFGPGCSQVWSLTQFNLLTFYNQGSVLKKCVFNNTRWVEGPWRASCQLKKALRESKMETRELLGGTDENSVSPMRGHWFALQANQWVCTKRKQKKMS